MTGNTIRRVGDEVDREWRTVLSAGTGYWRDYTSLLVVGDLYVGNPGRGFKGMCGTDVGDGSGWVWRSTEHLSPVEKTDPVNNGQVGDGESAIKLSANAGEKMTFGQGATKRVYYFDRDSFRYTALRTGVEEGTEASKIFQNGLVFLFDNMTGNLLRRLGDGVDLEVRNVHGGFLGMTGPDKDPATFWTWRGFSKKDILRVEERDPITAAKTGKGEYVWNVVFGVGSNHRICYFAENLYPVAVKLAGRAAVPTRNRGSGEALGRASAPRRSPQNRP